MRRHTILRLALLVLTCAAAFGVLVLPVTLRPASYPLKLGDVSSQDILAPSPVAYTSTVLTEEARHQAEISVPAVYLPADLAINRRQVEQLRLTLAFISSIRSDAYATREQKLADLGRLSVFSLTPESAGQIVSLTDNHWAEVQSEAVRILEAVMRETIRNDQLEQVRQRIPPLVSITLPEDQASLVSELASALVVANSLFSPDQTDAAVFSARNKVNPVTKSYMEGETIVPRGQIIDAARWEALQVFGLVKPTEYKNEIIGSLVLIAMLGVFTGVYMQRKRSYPMDDLRSLALIAFLFIAFLFGARLIIPNRTVLPYLYPLPAFALTIGVLFSMELGMILALVMGILAAFGLTNSLDLTLFYTISSLFGVLVMGRARKVANYFWAALAVGAAGAAVVIAYRLPDSITDLLGLATLTGAAAFNGLASASLTLLLQFLFAQALSLTTTLQLLEISRPDHPLLQYLLRNAPGTYQHSLQVANLAEQAAEAIGADPLLTRVGALYHDVGKAQNPLFFVENQVPGNLNPHDDLDPVLSAQTIIRHVADGLVMGRRHRLPPAILAFISQHHGTLVTRYQYARAVEAAGGDPFGVRIDHFRYPGPRPKTRETAILMLADGSEARARAELPKDEAELRITIKRVFDYCQSEGQLDETQITLRELNIISESFNKTLRGIYHPRLIYPDLTPALEPENPETIEAEFTEPRLAATNVPTSPLK